MLLNTVTIVSFSIRWQQSGKAANVSVDAWSWAVWADVFVLLENAFWDDVRASFVWAGSGVGLAVEEMRARLHAVMPDNGLAVLTGDLTFGAELLSVRLCVFSSNHLPATIITQSLIEGAAVPVGFHITYCANPVTAQTSIGAICPKLRDGQVDPFVGQVIGAYGGVAAGALDVVVDETVLAVDESTASQLLRILGNVQAVTTDVL